MVRVTELRTTRDGLAGSTRRTYQIVRTYIHVTQHRKAEMSHESVSL